MKFMTTKYMCLLCFLSTLLVIAFPTDLRSQSRLESLRENYPEEYSKFYKEFMAYKDKNGCAMTLSTFDEYANQHQVVDDRPIAYLALSDTQDPVVSKDELIDIFQSKIQAIEACYYEYDLHRPEPAQTFAPFERVTIAEKQGKSFCEVFAGDTIDELLLTSRSGYNGKVFKELNVSKESGVPSGTIDDNRERDNMHLDHKVLLYSYLLEHPTREQKDNYHSIEYLFERNCLVQEKMEVIDGRPCVHISDGIAHLYLDPALDFSVVQFRETLSERDDSGLLHYYTVNEHNFSDFVDCGNSVYLPQKIVAKKFKEGKEVGNKWALSAHKININEADAIPDKLFEEIFDNGTRVVDRISSLIYTKGYPGIVETELDVKMKKHDLVSKSEPVQAEVTSFEEKAEEIIVEPKQTILANHERENSFVVPLIIGLVVIVFFVVALALFIVRRRSQKIAAVLLLIVSSSSLAGGLQAGESYSFQTQPCCGPVCAYTVLQYYGKDTTLEAVSEQCNYQGKSVKIGNVCKVFEETDGLKYSVKKYSIENLRACLKGPEAAVLLSFDNSAAEDEEGEVIKADHLVTLLKKDETVYYVDYTKIIDNFDINKLPENVHGHFVVVSRCGLWPFSQTKENIAFLVMLGLVIMALVLLVRKKKQQTLCSPILVFFIVIGSIGLSPSCLSASEVKVELSNVTIADSGEEEKSGTKAKEEEKEAKTVSVNDALIWSKAICSRSVDFGVLEKSPRYITKIQVINDHKQDIIIDNVLVSCSSCITPRNIPSRIKQGVPTIISYNLDTHGKRGEINVSSVLVGRFEDDDSKASLKIKMEAFGQGVWLEHAILDIGSMMSNTKRGRYNKIFSAGHAGIEIGQIKCPENIVCEVQDPKKGEKDKVSCLGSLYIEYQAGEDLGRDKKSIEIEFNQASVEPLTLPVHAYVLGDVQITPPKLLFISRNKDVTNKCTITCRNEDLFPINAQDIAFDCSEVDIFGQVKSIKQSESNEVLLECQISFNATDSQTGKMKKTFHIDVLCKDKLLCKVPCMLICW